MPDENDIDQVLEAAVALQEAGQFDLAEAGYRTVLQHDADEPDALNLLGLILQQRGELDGSIALITRALAIVPDFPEALANLARARRAAGTPGLAADAARRAIALDPDLMEAHLQLGRALLDQGDYVGAAASLRRATSLAPSSVDALQELGLALLRLDDPSSAAESLTAALELNPNRPDATFNLALALARLARAHRAAGEAEAAVRAARRAVALDPTQPDAQLELGCALLVQQDVVGAVEVLRRATVIAPNSLESHVVLARALTYRKDHASAAEVWRAALALKPEDPDLMIGLAGALGELGRFSEALAIFRRADTLVPNHPRVQHGIALCLVHTSEIAAAAEVCRRAVETTPDWPVLWTLLANCDAKLGHFGAAANAYRRTLALAPGSMDVLHDLIALGERFDDDMAKNAARDVLSDQTQPVRDRVAAGFTLGQVSDRGGEYDEAFEAYATANRLLRADRAAHGFKFDRNNDRLLVDRLIATIGPRTFAETSGWGDPSELPVFVVGMPRSGTTLVEQIAASHPSVYGAGERTDIHGILTALGGEQTAWWPGGWDLPSVRRETTDYRRRLREMGGNAARVIDKLPINVMFLGQIAVLFPRARIVVCRRDLRDVGLSCFFQYFRDDTMVWADDLADIGFRARQIDRVMQHWRNVLPVPILEIEYETLVANLETESRRLTDFLGLEWDPACVSFHETERAVHTASRWQVRQPLYTSSTGRWHHYRRYLEPLLQELDGLVHAR